MDVLPYKPSQFIGFLPYFCLSKKAFELVAFQQDDPTPYIDFSPVLSMQERIMACNVAHATNKARITKLKKRGYITETVLKYGDAHWKSFRTLRLSKSALYALTGVIDEEEEKRRQAGCAAQRTSPLSSFKAQHDEDCKDLMQALGDARQREYEKSSSDTIQGKNKFRDDLVQELIEREGITLLGIFDPRHLSLATMSECYTGHQLYKLWRLSNAEALFRVNGFLTSLDRRPFDAVWRLQDSKTLTEKATMPVYESFGDRRQYIPEVTQTCHKKEKEWKEKRDKKTLLDYCQDTLKTWYSAHPESFFYSDPFAHMDDTDKGRWKVTPSFYPAFEIPGFGGEIPVETSMIATGANNILHYNFIGLGVGTHCNYLVYHTRPMRTNWSETTERSTALAVQLVMDKCGKNEGLNGTGREINYALIVCMSGDQFVGLFRNEREKIPQRWHSVMKIGAPFDAVNIVTMNRAGAMLLRGIMLTSPVQFEEILVNGMVNDHPDLFTKTNDPQYQLAYNNTPVLVAHSMNFAKLYRAWEDYEQGIKFYVSCYPEQVQYLRALLPEAEFL